jgi:hypothetical protein
MEWHNSGVPYVAGTSLPSALPEVPLKPASSKTFFLFAVVVIWLAGIGYGTSKLLRYSFTPAPTPHASAVWPANSALRPSPSAFTLVMVAHPQCPCTQASLSELEIIMARFRDRLRAKILFIQPDGMTADWVKSGLWKHAESIPETDVVMDPDGREIRRFGGVASGQVFLYNPGGKLVFSGGITASRGHVGSNAGEDAVAALLMGTNPPDTTSASFGCYLFNDD